jgi:hypothetical protein
MMCHLRLACLPYLRHPVRLGSGKAQGETLPAARCARYSDALNVWRQWATVARCIRLCRIIRLEATCGVQSCEHCLARGEHEFLTAFLLMVRV